MNHSALSHRVLGNQTPSFALGSSGWLLANLDVFELLLAVRAEQRVLLEACQQAKRATGAHTKSPPALRFKLLCARSRCDARSETARLACRGAGARRRMCGRALCARGKELIECAPVLSSMMHADTPAASSVRTVK